MTLNDYRETYSWRAAIELGRPLTLLTEELPAQENSGLITALQSLMVELPSAIASDLIGGTNTRQAAYVRIQSILELIERVYPALDTAESKTKLDELIERTESTAFAEVHVDPIPDEEDDDNDEPGEPAEAPAQAVEVATESV